METTLTAAPTATLRGNFVLLRADSLRLLLPQQDVGAAEYVEHQLRTTAEPGMFADGEGDDARRVVAPSGQLSPLVSFPSDRFVLTRLVGTDRELFFAWNEVHVLIDAQFQRHSLPAAMQVAGAPIDGYVSLNGELALCSTAQCVVSHTLTPGA